MERTTDQWQNCSPEAMARMSPTAISIALTDAKKDQLELREKNAQLREWARLAFRVINHVGPLMLTIESESSAEEAMIERLRELAEAVAMQYPAISGIEYTKACQDAAAALC